MDTELKFLKLRSIDTKERGVADVAREEGRDVREKGLNC